MSPGNDFAGKCTQAPFEMISDNAKIAAPSVTSASHLSPPETISYPGGSKPMAVVEIAHKPTLTKEEARAAFARHFSGKYAVEEWTGRPRSMRDFMIVKNGFVAVTVKLEQAANETKLVYSGFTPKFWARLITGAVASMLLWNGLTNELKQFIATAPEFH
jgi:hypothetical protein